MIVEALTYLVYLAVSYVIVTYISHVVDTRNYPPGPVPIPLLGNLHLFGPNFPEIFHNLSKKYGPVFSFSFGTDRIVIVNSIVATKEALVDKGSIFAGRRTNNRAIGYYTREFRDIAFADYGPYWRRARKVAHSALKIFDGGMGKLETKIVKQYEKLECRLRNCKNQPVDLGLQLRLTVLNVICSKIFNSDYELDDPEFKLLLEFSKLQDEGFGSPDLWLQGILPILQYFPLKCFRKFKQAGDIRDSFIDKKLTEHERSFDAERIRDFTDSLLNALREDNEVGKESCITRSDLEMIIADVFFAGYDTTATTLKWCVLYLLHWPQYQELIYEEMTSVLNEGKRYPTLKERTGYPMTQAVIQETLRLSTVVVMTIEHKALENDSIGGKPVPKDAGVFFNLWSLHNDEDVWAAPRDFNPYRWLDEDGNFCAGKYKNFLPFSTGKRVCLGESVAKAELFLIVSRMLRDFKILPNVDEPLPSLKGDIGLVYFPQDFTVILDRRE